MPGVKRQVKLLCYPMPGPVTKQFETLLDVLRAVTQRRDAQADLVAWMRRTYSLSESYARKVYMVLIQGTGLVRRQESTYSLTQTGKGLLESRDADTMYQLFARTFFGIEILVRAIAKSQPVTWDDLCERWRTAVREAREEPRFWSAQHLRSQLRFRLDWLRSLQRIDFVAGRYYLSRTGLHGLAARTRRSAKQAGPRGRSAATQSHNDIENKLTTIGAFFQFDVKKRASVNDILPAANRLREDRQVDSLWVRFVHFGGRVQYPFEVQLSGSIADAIERLEMVANFVQKAVVVTDEVQQRRMMDRLAAKRSVLLDKVVFLSPDEIDKIVEATIVMKSFTEALFKG